MVEDSNIEKSERVEKSFKEKRLKDILFIYYSRPDVRKAMFEFSKNRECVPSYMMESFGKRPDAFQYESDILAQVMKGATSFHCSEELWKDPLEISNELSEKEFNDLRIGWDLFIDLDSPYLEYSKIYADLLIKILEKHNIDNIGVKFSGSKGFHIIVPWKAFPQRLYGQETKNMFPEWPRLICQYLTEKLQDELEDEILEQGTSGDLAKRMGKNIDELLISECINCKRPAIKKMLITWKCPHCIREITNLEGTFNNRKKARCPDCRQDLIEIKRKEVYFCDFCKTNSNRSPEKFTKPRVKTEALIEADLVLVAPRHLVRMPYSLHEKTALSSIVIDKDKVKEFQIRDANALKVEIKQFYPNAKKGEAKELLIKAIDWQEQKKQKENLRKEYSMRRRPFEIETELNSKGQAIPISSQKSNSEYKKIIIPNPREEIFPPCIKNILKGIKDDGRKRALFVLINFFKSLGVEGEELEKRLDEWNQKNYKPLKQGYIRSQLNWYKRTGARMPPNCDKTNYQDLNVCKPDELCRLIKNPLNYTIKKYFKRGMVKKG